MVLERVRQPLLDEARRSPALLSDLAGLERIVAETYDARSFVELLQNADDAGASRFTVRRDCDFLLVANDGHQFTQAEFESLCRSAASSKLRGESIGFRGIGFKSVVGFADEVHLLSGELEATFSRERTAREVPQATQVPLIRIPHPLEAADRLRFGAEVGRLMGEGFGTVFVFAGLIARGIEAEFAAFDATALLFLRNVRQVELRAGGEALITLRRDGSEAGVRALRLASAEGVSQWSVREREGIALAFIQDESGLARLEERRAVVHAFLPTHEPTGFPFKLNGDISTDPSRTRIVLDERTAACVETAARFIVELVQKCLSGGEDQCLLAALVPMSDPRMAGFQRRSFRTELYAAVQRVAKGAFEDLYLRPAWLNAVDFEKLAAEVGMRAVPRKLETVEGLAGFLKFLAAKEAAFRHIAPALETMGPTDTGAADIVAHLTTLHSTRQVRPEELDRNWILWPTGGGILSLEEAQRANAPLTPEFVAKVAEKAASSVELERLVTAMSSAETAAHLLPKREASTGAGAGAQPRSSPTLPPVSLKRWRGAEQQVLALLLSRGWKVEDVSRQNIGYDIEGKNPEGEDVCVEVKAIDYPGQAFTLTSNEEAVARQKGRAYRLALVRQTNAQLEMAFIADPVNQLKLTRQCRQWVWECATYGYEPEIFALD